MRTTAEDAPCFQPYSRDHLIQACLPSKWHLLVACILLNLTRRTEAWDHALYEIFGNWTGASSLKRSSDELERILEPFGMSSIKAKRLRRMSEEYENWDGDDPRDLHGIGQYGYDSWRIFVCGERPHPDDVGDKELKKFLVHEATPSL